MEETEPMPMGDRRHHRKLVRFDPTFSTGSIATILSLIGTMLLAYGKYEADRERTRYEIESLKANALAEKIETRAAVNDLRTEVRGVQATITSVDKTVTTIKAEIDAKKGQRP
jgi:uncharacterized protein YlxW (UPF0749 family)